MKTRYKDLLDIPTNFGIVEDDVYRCSNTLNHSQVQYLKTLGLRTALVLSLIKPSKEFTHFMEKHNVKVITFDDQVDIKEPTRKPVQEELIKEALEVVLDRSNHPLLITCPSGVTETGALVGCLRKLQKWNFNSIIFECRSFGSRKSRYSTELFVELFDTDLVNYPKLLPSWFNNSSDPIIIHEEELSKP